MPSPSRRLWPALATAALLAVIVRLAWLGDDAYITLRTVENLFAGRGLVWNSGERVQTYTHPAWMLLLALGRLLTGECYYSTLAWSFVLSAGAALVVQRLGGHAAAATAAAVLLLSSRAFTEYSTGGLENPLTHLLAALLVAAGWSDAAPERRYARTVLLAALLACTRMDLLVLAAPFVVAAARGVGWRSRAQRGALAALPFVAWVLFATFYYGTPFPVTAYAKAIAHGVPQARIAEQGLQYFVDSARSDPATLLVIAAGVAVGLARPALRGRWPAIAALAYCAYVVKIGGDFMSGRFLTPPFVVAAALLARWCGTVAPRWSFWCGAAALGAMLLGGVPVWCRAPASEPLPRASWHTIVDERGNYVESLGCWHPRATVPVAGATSALLRQANAGPMVVAFAQCGRYAFEAGDLVHVCDPWLLDPLLMRLPVPDPATWRIGHFERRIPEGYLESLATGENRIHHAALRRYHDALRCVLRAPLADSERLRTTWRLLTGAFDADLAAFVASDYRDPPRLRIDVRELTPLPPVGSYWFRDPRIRVVYAGGLAVQLPAPASAAKLRVRVAGVEPYTFRLVRGTDVVATLRLAPTKRWEFGLQEYELDVPADAGAFDTIQVDGLTRFDTIATFGGVELVP